MDYISGYVKLSRALIKWEWYMNIIVKSAFIHCLLSANWEDKKWQGEVVKKGSFITTRSRFAEESGLTIQQVRGAWTKLESTGEILKKSTNNKTLIIVNNWDKYQCVLDDDNQRITNKQPTDNQRVTTTKEYKETKDRLKDRLIINNNDAKELCEILGFNTLSKRQCLVIQEEWFEYKTLDQIVDIVERAKEHNPKNLFNYVHSIIMKSISKKEEPEKIKLVEYDWWEEEDDG